MQVRIRQNGMLRSVEDMKKIRSTLDACESELARIRRELAMLSGMEQPIGRIRRCEENVETESRYSILFGSTLTNICRLYGMNEDRLVDYSEAVRKAAVRESLSRQNLSGLYEIFHKAGF